MSEVANKTLAVLRVCDLKGELEKRKLDTTGQKAALVDRLEKALRNEGKDPSTYVFGSEKGSSETVELPKPIKEEPMDNGDEFDTVDGNVENGGQYDDDGNEIDQVGTVDDECIILENGEDGESGLAEENQQVPASDDNGKNDDEPEENSGECNNQDNEEEINLTIGEDEQKLLHDEAPDDKEKTCEGGSNEKNITLGKNNATIKETNLNKSNNSNNSSSSTARQQKRLSSKDSGVTAKNTTSGNSSGGSSSNSNNKKKDDKTSDKKDESVQKSSKTSQKDEKEKNTNTATPSSGSGGGSVGNNGSGGSGGGGGSSSSGTVSNSVVKTTASVGGSTSNNSSSKSITMSRNLWVSGLSSLTRASDLKTIFSKHGKVIGAKVVTNTRTPGTRCYGYVTMASSSDASRCIDHLHRTELHGRIISVERTKNELGSSSSATTNVNVGKSSSTGSGNAMTTSDNGNKPKKDEDGKPGVSASSKTDHGDRRKSVPRRGAGSSKDESGDKRSLDSKTSGGGPPPRRHLSSSKDHKKDDAADRAKSSRRPPSRSLERGRSRDHPMGGRDVRQPRDWDRERERARREREILSFEKIREERERQRLRERERHLREEERRRRETRERQRLEEQRLAEERRKLAQERERLEREKAELLRLERERQKLEREKIELERLELKRQQMKIIQSREEPLKRMVKHTGNERYAEVPDRKRSSNTDRFEAPPPPRFDASLVSSRSYDKKRDDYGTSSVSSSKRASAVDPYIAPSSSSSSKRIEYGSASVNSKRDSDYTGSASKRSAIDDYSAVPSKRSSDDYGSSSKRDYLPATGTSSSRRGGGGGIDDYTSSKSRDEYKREVEIRHIPTTGSAGISSNSYHSSRDDPSSAMHKSSGSSARYVESERGVSSGGYRRSAIDDIRSSTAGNKRYENTSGYNSVSASGSNGVWVASHMSHSSANGAPIKSYNGGGSTGISANMHGVNQNWPKAVPMDDSSWRPGQSSQDRYDRTYNERSSGYIAAGNTGAGDVIYGGGRSQQDRYTTSMSTRY